MDEEYNYSLCLALPNLSDGNSLYRIADYDPDSRKFDQALYEWTANTPIQISSAKSDGVADEVEIRRWITLDEKWQRSHLEELRFGYVYEVLFPNEMINQPLSNDQLRQVLFDGIYLPKGIARYFLLVLDVTSDSYRVLLCDKNAFKFEGGKYYIEKQVRNLKNAVTEFDLLYIYNDQLISTESLKNKLSWYTEETRYFYNSIIIPEGSKKIKLRSSKDYTVGFFAQYLKGMEMRSKYSNQIRSNLMTELEYIEKNHELVEQFFAPSGDDYKNASSAFKENITDLIDYIISSESNEKDLFLKILEGNKNLSDKFEEKIEDRWMSMFNQNIVDKENKLLTVQKEYDYKNQELNALIADTSKVQAKYQKINKELEQMTSQKHEIEKQIKNELTNFQSNIVEQYKMSALFMGNQSMGNSNSQRIIEYSSSNLVNVEPFRVSSLKDTYEGIKYNLENFMKELNASKFTLAIIAALTTNKLLILPEFESENIVNAFSLILTGKQVKVINILNEDYDLTYVINQINSSKESYVLIKGHLDLFNETSINTLINRAQNKKVVFTINDEKSLNLFSNNLWNYCIYLNPTDVFEVAEDVYWKKQASQSKFDLEMYNATPIELSKEFENNFMKRAIFTPYIQEEMLHVMSVYNGLYKELIDSTFQLSSLKDLPFNQQILTVNRDRLSEMSKYFERIGIDSEILNYYE